MQSPQLNTNQLYTTSDYLKWNDGKRYELYSGKVYEILPTSTIRHQRVVGYLYSELELYLRGKNWGEVFIAPVDVFLNEHTVLQPDIIVVRNLSKINEDGGCNGVPDLVVEVLSPLTKDRDLKYKYALYEKAGVHEYWVVSPLEEMIWVFRLNKKGRFRLDQICLFGDKLKAGIFEDLEIDLKTIFTKRTL